MSSCVPHQTGRAAYHVAVASLLGCLSVASCMICPPLLPNCILLRRSSLTARRSPVIKFLLSSDALLLLHRRGGWSGMSPSAQKSCDILSVLTPPMSDSWSIKSLLLLLFLDWPPSYWVPFSFFMSTSSPASTFVCGRGPAEGPDPGVTATTSPFSFTNSKL